MFQVGLILEWMLNFMYIFRVWGHFFGGGGPAKNFFALACKR